MSPRNFDLPHSDREILRRLAERVRTIADSPRMEELRTLWTRHNRLDSQRPMVLIETCGVREELPYLIGRDCQSDFARGIEGFLRSQLYQAETVKDDTVIEPYFPAGWSVGMSDYGVSMEQHRSDGGEDGLGSYVWDPPLSNLGDDFGKLKKRTFSVDRETTRANNEAVDSVIGDILPVKMRGVPWWTMGMTMTAIHLVGLQNLMLYMYDDPEGLHRLMNFLMQDHMALLDWMEAEDLVNLNNRADYIGSGSQGHSDEIGYPEPERVKIGDLWGLSESQETVGVSPELFDEFVFKYQQPVIERFGLCYYGCCEPVHTRWHVIRRIQNLRKVSISPWCDEEMIAAEMGRDYVYCRKPNPTLISTDNFDENAIREDLRKTLAICRDNNCPLEFAMKDVHTVKRKPERLARWVELAREEIKAGS
jgi:hypothetical protein